MNKLTLIITAVAIQFTVTVFSTMFIISYIEKHSVHPTYGNYQKVGATLGRCAPWDDCR